MDRAHAKLRIAQIQYLALPSALRRRVTTLISRPSPNPDELLELVSSDMALALSVYECAAIPDGSARGFDQRLRAVEMPLLRKAIAAVATAEDSGVSQGAELIRLWRHSTATAVLAKRLAIRTGSVSPQEAWFAGLFHDLGKLALLSFDAERYHEVAEMVERAHIESCEAERVLLDFDHTEAGKWLAERKSFPQPLTDVIWLHHHAPDTMTARCFPVNLIALTSLANTLSRSLDNAADDSLQEVSITQGQRFGLEAAGLREILRDSAQEFAERSALIADTGEPFARPEEALRGAFQELHASLSIGAGEVSSLRREIRRLQALIQFYLSIAPGESLNGILSACATCIRQSFELAPGICFATGATRKHLIGKSWRSLKGPPADLFVELGEGGGGEDESTPMLRAVRELSMAKIEQGWTGAAAGEVQERDGLFVLPLAHGGSSYGQIIVDASGAGFGMSENDVAGLLAIARACGAAVARHHAEERNAARMEELAHALRTGRTDDEKTRAGYARITGADKTTKPSEGPKAMSRFAGATAKALEGPLGLISSQAQRLLAKSRDLESHQALDSIVKESRRLSKILSDLHAFAPHPQPRLEPNLINFRLHQFMAAMKQRLEKKGVRIEELFAEGLPRVMLDPRRMEHVFMNLLIHAQEALGESGGKITIKTGASPDRRSVIIHFSHGGPGIAPDLRAQAFEPFQDACPGDRVAGMGLAVCRSILEEHGGQIAIETGPGGGDLFSIVLPAAGVSRGEDLSNERPEIAQPSADFMTVLVVDDDEGVREILKQTLQMRGYQVEVAADGVQAWDAIRKKTPHIVLLDLLMPNRDGLTVLRDLRKLKDAPPVIFMTGNASPQVRDEAMTLGARSFLLKPFELRRLLAELEGVLAPHA